MYHWNIQALKKELIADALTESQVFAYFMAVLVLETLLFNVAMLTPGTEDKSVWDYIDFVGSVAFTLGGTLVAYRVNGGSAGRAFLSRFFPLMWVLTVRFLAALLALILIATIFMILFSVSLFGTETGSEDFAVLTMADAMLSWAWFLVFYYRLAVHLRDVARAA